MNEDEKELQLKLLNVGRADCPRVESKINEGRNTELTIGRKIVALGEGPGVCIKNVDYGTFKASYNMATFALREWLTPLVAKHSKNSVVKLEFRESPDEWDVYGARHTWYLYE